MGITQAEEAKAVAKLLLQQFNHFYNAFKEVPQLAKQAFEQHEHKTSLELSGRRLQLYSISIRELSNHIKEEYPQLSENEEHWDEVEIRYSAEVSEDYASDLAMAYLHSIRRKIYQGEWRVADYSKHRQKYESDQVTDGLLRRYEINGKFTAATVEDILNNGDFSVSFKNIADDSRRIVERAMQNYGLNAQHQGRTLTLEMFKAGFFRNRGAYLVGRVTFDGSSHKPFIIALLNSVDGLYVDALITSSTYAHNMFSSTLANFHVTSAYYHDLCHFLRSVMPRRPLGLHYSTIGYNHLGKLAVMNELETEYKNQQQLIDLAPGVEGTVAIGFCIEGSAYVMKIIRDKPTDKYKWGKFDGVGSVLKKYMKVHEINRTDSMLDSIIYYQLRLPADRFAPELKEKLLEFASESVWLDGDGLVFKYLIVQRRMTPLPVYLKEASEREAETAMINLGYCIKNNAAGNIFNKDLDARNYGVSSTRKVYLFDYDALEELKEVKIRTNLDREDGEEDIPDWYFEEGPIFLPEELVAGLCLPDRKMRKIFESHHEELQGMVYWEAIQQDLQQGRVPRVSVYPDTEKLH